MQTTVIAYPADYSRTSGQPATSRLRDYLAQLTDPEFFVLYQRAMHSPLWLQQQWPGMQRPMLIHEARRRHITVLQKNRMHLRPRILIATITAAMTLAGVLPQIAGSLISVSGL